MEGIEQALAHHRWRTDQLGASRTMSHMAAERPWVNAPRPTVVLPPADMSNIVHPAAIAQLWRTSSRIACLVDPTLAQEVRGATSDTLPTDVFRSLPYINPLIVFADPIPCTTTDNRPAKLLGFYVYGLTGHGTDTVAFCTTDTSPSHLGILAVLQETHGAYIQHEMNRLAIPMDVDRLTLPEYITHAAQNHPVDFLTALGATEQSIRTGIESILRPALSALLYLCTKDADLDEQQPRLHTGKPGQAKKKKSGQKKTSKQRSFVYVGWRLGAKLRRYLAAAERGATSSPTTHTGRTQPPRQRASHFKTVWVNADTGKKPKTVFVLPYWIHRDQIDWETTPSTLVPTGRKRKSKQSRRSRSRAITRNQQAQESRPTPLNRP
ncbi:hypothetical protein [Nocardia carnea]|uniref:hypothetical protein n=1 Tax=Nocardia carnea TaxID=37328 RepID=UPI002455FC4D|nr:hypothetical protein [Nocardia carnea]